MKKLFLSCGLACIAAFACTNNTYAQSNTSRFGLKAGATLMTMGNADNGNGTSTGYDYRLGFQGGLFAVTAISDKVDFMPQILYTQKGGNAKFSATISGTTVSAQSKTEIDYLDIPFLFGFKPKPGLTFTLGPQASFLLSQKTTASASNGSSSASNSTTSTDGLRKTIIGGNLGMSVALNKDMAINLNYLLDFQRLGDNNAGAGTTEKNSGFALSLSYLF